MRIFLRVVCQLLFDNSHRQRLIRKGVPFRCCLLTNSVLAGLKQVAGRLPGTIISGSNGCRHLSRMNCFFMIGVENDIKVICIDDFKCSTLERRVAVRGGSLLCGDLSKLQVAEGRDISKFFRVDRNISNLRLSGRTVDDTVAALQDLQLPYRFVNLISFRRLRLLDRDAAKRKNVFPISQRSGNQMLLIQLRCIVPISVRQRLDDPGLLWIRLRIRVVIVVHRELSACGRSRCRIPDSRDFFDQCVQCTEKRLIHNGKNLSG